MWQTARARKIGRRGRLFFRATNMMSNVRVLLLLASSIVQVKIPAEAAAVRADSAQLTSFTPCNILSNQHPTLPRAGPHQLVLSFSRVQARSRHTTHLYKDRTRSSQPLWTACLRCATDAAETQTQEPHGSECTRRCNKQKLPRRNGERHRTGKCRRFRPIAACSHPSSLLQPR
jgi:hypothetical protein